MLSTLSTTLLVLLPLASAQASFTQVPPPITPTSIITISPTSTTSISAQTTISLYLPDTDPQPLVASVLSATAQTTIYRISCPPDTDATDCGFPQPVDVTAVGTTRFAGAMSAPGFAFSFDCQVHGSAVCSESAGGSAANFPGVSTETVPVESATFLPVAVTAGVEKLGGGAGAAVTSSSGTGSSGTGGTATASGTAKGSGTAAANAAEGGFAERVWYAVLGMGLVAGVFNML